METLDKVRGFTPLTIGDLLSDAMSDCVPNPDPSDRLHYHVRRDKAALFQRVQAPPGDRSSRKQPEQAWRRRNV